MSGRCGPVFTPRDWILYESKRKGISEVDVGEIIVITPIESIHRKLIEYFGAKEWEKWIYPPGEKWSIHRRTLNGVGVSFMRIGVGAGEAGVLEEVLVLGVKQVVFAGIGGGLGVEIGDIVVPYGAICEDGLSQHYIPLGIPVEASRRLVEAMVNASRSRGLKVHVGRVWTTTAPYREHFWKAEEYYSRWECRAVEMEVAAVYALSTYYNVSSVALLVISDLIYPHHEFGFHSKVYENSLKQVPAIIGEYLKRVLST